jgi:hypothetical protein
MVARELVPPWIVAQTGVGAGDATGLVVGETEALGEGAALGDAASLGVGVDCRLPPIVADPQALIRTQSASRFRIFMLEACRGCP